MAERARILLIEDDRDISSTLQRVLSAAGYDLLLAINGLEGQDLARKHKPDLVITDMMMPRLGGFPVLEFLKSQPDPPKVIMITANEGARHKAYAEMLGVDDYIRKPFAMDVLLDAVARVLGKPANASATTASEEEGDSMSSRRSSKSSPRSRRPRPKG